LGSELMSVDTTLFDLDGREHRYETVPFAFDQCFDLGLELAAMVGGPLGEAFKSVLLGGNAGALDLDEKVLGQAIGALGELPGRVIAAGGSKLIARILATTTRIATVGGELRKQPLLDDGQRTAAFGGGNLREAIDAVRWVLTVNYGPFVESIWGDLRPQLAGLAMSAGIGPEHEAEMPPSEPKSAAMKPSEIL